MRTKSLSAAFLFSCVGISRSQPEPQDTVLNLGPEPTTVVDVAIIGGGSAGTFAAVKLHDAGKKVVVIERSGRLGGHADTFHHPVTREPINVGVQRLHDIPVVRAYFQRLGVALSPLRSSSGTRVSADFRTGISDPSYAPPSSVALNAALVKYSNILNSTYPYLAEPGINLPDPVPEELLIPFGDFVVRHNLSAAVTLFNAMDQPNEIWRQPTLYILKIVGRSIMNDLLLGLAVETRDLMDIYRAAADVLGDSVLYGSRVLRLRRGCKSGNVTITVETQSGIKHISAKRLVMAAPPMLTNLDGWDATAEERRLFGKFSRWSYHASVFINAALGKGRNGTQVTSISNIGGLDTPFRVPHLPAVLSISSVGNDTWRAYVGQEGSLSREDGQTLMVTTIAKLIEQQGWGVAGDEAGKDTRIRVWYDHTPVKLHVSADEIQAGFYKDLMALQGRKSTWWVGGAFECQDSSEIWKHVDVLLAGF